MELVEQPPGSYKCTQACVAMVAGVSLKQSIKAFGLEHATNLYALRNALKKLGFDSAEKYYCFGKKPKRLPSTCILRLVWPKRKVGHCVVWHDGQVYDPGYGIHDFEELLLGGKVSITYLRITKK
jgi:hypothetical protein